MNIRILTALIATFGLSCGAFASVLTGNLTNGLVSYYEFNGNGNDSVGGNNATINGATIAEDRFGNTGKALQIIAPNGGAISLQNITITGNSDRTVSYWFKYGDNSWLNYIGVGWGNTSGVGTIFQVNAVSSQSFHLWGNYGDVITDLSTPLDYNSWQNITLVYQANLSNTKIYLNGSVQTEYSFNVNGQYNPADTLNTISTPLTMYGNTGGDYIDDVAIFNRALSSTEVSALYSAQVIPEPSTYVLFGIGAVGMLMFMRRKKTA